MEEKKRAGIPDRRGGENGMIAVWMKAPDDKRAGRFIDAQTLRSNADASVWSHARG